ncbi:MAG: EAL domain-containing protein [Pseudomonadota bacterium]
MFSAQLTTAPEADASTAQASTTFDLDIFMAYQPVVDVEAEKIVAYEALVRGASGRAEASLLSRVTAENRADFDRRCRRVAIETGSALGLERDLSINFMPSAVEDCDDFIQTLQWTAEEFDFPMDQLMLEYSETDRHSAIPHLKEICRLTRRTGVRTVIDDFGGGFAGLTRFTYLRPSMVKLDPSLTTKIDLDPRRRAIVSGVQAICFDLGIDLVAKGVETPTQAEALRDCGVVLMQGIALAEPALERILGDHDITIPASIADS